MATIGFVLMLFEYRAFAQSVSWGARAAPKRVRATLSTMHVVHASVDIMVNSTGACRSPDLGDKYNWRATQRRATRWLVTTQSGGVERGGGCLTNAEVGVGAGVRAQVGAGVRVRARVGVRAGPPSYRFAIKINKIQ